VDTTLNRINVVVLFVEDLERSKAFYGTTLGLTVMDEDPQSAIFKLDTVMLMLLTNAAAQDLLSDEAVATQRPAGARSQLVSFVDDVDAVYQELAAKGVEFIRTPVDRAWGMRTAHFRDPDGHVWELAQQLS